MGYVLGIDLGTTYTAAAVLRDGRASIVDLGTRQAAVPSVVFLRDDETVLTGEAANRRGLTEPDRIAREFKRRVGDPTPILLGGAPISVQALMAKVLRWVVDTVTEREGGPPDAVAVSHPANWGPYKTDVLAQAVRMADLGSAALLTEPEAAAIHYASQERIEPGTTIAVYDLGGGTFDASVLRKSVRGWEVLGQPEGIDRLGGIDFDAAVFAHVARSLDGRLDELDPDDPAAQAAVARLRDDCVAAKEALSVDTDVSIPVLLPNVSTEVRLTRAEFEAMIRPALADSIDSLRRALRSAGVQPEEVTAVLLVGGSSRVPLVAQLVGAELGRPVALDVHPKHAVALGAAIAAGHAEDRAVTDATPSPVAAPPAATPPPAVAAPAAVAPVSSPALPPTPPPAAAPPPAAGPSPAAPAGEPTVVLPRPAPLGAPGPAAPPTSPAAPVTSPAPAAASLPPSSPVVPPTAPPTVPPTAPPTPAGAGGPPRGVVIGAGIVAVVALLAIAALLLGGGDDGDEVSSDTSTPTGATDPDTSATTGPVSSETSAVDPASGCDRARQVCITGVSFEGDDLVATYETDLFLTLPTSPESVHAHFYLSPALSAETSGTNGGTGGWQIWATEGEYSARLQNVGVDGEPLTRADVGANTDLCVTVANELHQQDPATEDCFPLPV